MAHTSHSGPGADPHTDHGLESVAVHHEVTDIPLGGISRAAIISIVFVGLVFVLMWGAWGFFQGQAMQNDPGKPAMAAEDFGQRVPATPRLQSVPGSDLTSYRAEQTAKLNILNWVDQSAGTVRIPIATAMQLIVHRADAFADQQAKAPEDHSWSFPGAARTDLADAPAAAPATEHAPAAAPAAHGAAPTPTPAPAHPPAAPTAPPKH
jgi:hypothetical protein